MKCFSLESVNEFKKNVMLMCLSGTNTRYVLYKFHKMYSYMSGNAPLPP